MPNSEENASSRSGTGGVRVKGLYFAVGEEGTTTDQSFRSLPRKARFFDTANSFQAPSSSVQVAGNEGDPDTVYGDDKRIVHTGPNPLHN
ncbi:hypothetical protein PTKIN_Ptkin02bG0054700 [Pterospermum kingtungense]